MKALSRIIDRKGRIRRPLRPKQLRRAPRSASPSQLFFYGWYRETLKRHLELPFSEQSVDDLHSVVAAAALLDEQLEHLVIHLPVPPSIGEARELLQRQAETEFSHPQVNLLRQPAHVYKPLLAAMIGLTLGKTIFVETGTFVGQSSYFVSRLFSEVLTVEASVDLALAARRLMEATNTENVKVVQGASVDLLQNLSLEAGQSAVFFLDAHYSTGLTSRLFGACPLVDELTIIFKRFDNPVIIVDDLRTMTGLGGYPSIAEILACIPSSFAATIACDQLIVAQDAIGISRQRSNHATPIRELQVGGVQIGLQQFTQ